MDGEASRTGLGCTAGIPRRGWCGIASAIALLALIAAIPAAEPAIDLPPIELPPIELRPPDLPSEAGLRLKLPMGRRWDFDFAPFTGSQWPTAGDEPDRRGPTEYGIRLGGGWTLSPRLHLRFELPYALGQLPELRAAGQGTQGAGETVPGSLTRVEGLLTLSFQF